MRFPDVGELEPFRALRSELGRRHRRMLGALQLRLSRREAGLDALIEAFWRLPEDSQIEALLTPGLSLWLHTASLNLIEASEGSARLLQTASHAFTAPLLRAGLTVGAPVRLWSNRWGEIIFSGERFKLDVGLRGRALDARLSEGRLELSGVRWKKARREEFISGTDIEVSNADPFIAETIGATRTATDTFNRARLKITAWRRKADLDAAAETLARLRDCWPEMHREILHFTKLLVPVDGKRQQAGTLKPMLGGILFPFKREWWLNLENLIHENTHLKLSFYGLLDRFVEDDERYIVSPWSGIKRRPSILVQAGYIYALAAEGLQRAAQAASPSARDAIAARRRHLLAGFPGYRKIIAGAGLTPLGRGLVEACLARGGGRHYT